jgi:prophage regulatory protein
MVARGAFPRPIRLGKRAVGWRERDVTEWLESREQAVS